MRWSSRMTQSLTYSSRPCRVSVPSPRSAVMIAVTPRSLSQRNSRRSSDRRIACSEQPAEEDLDRVEHHPLRPDRVDGEAQPDEQPLQVVLAGLLDLASLDVDVIDRQQATLGEAVQVEAERANVLRQLLGGLLEGNEDARARRSRRPPGRGTPCRRGSCRSRQRRRPGVGRPRGRPPPVISSSPGIPEGHLARDWRSRSSKSIVSSEESEPTPDRRATWRGDGIAARPWGLRSPLCRYGRARCDDWCIRTQAYIMSNTTAVCQEAASPFRRLRREGSEREPSPSRRLV